MLGECGAAGSQIQDDLVAEFGRYGAAELHCVATIMGGIGAQEAIKVITRQFIPLDKTLVYNGIQSTTSVIDV